MCGIAMIRLKDRNKAKDISVLELLCYVLYQMTHRGQGGAGFAWPFRNRLEAYKNFGYAEEVYGRLLKEYKYMLEKLVTHQALGHVRYPTEGTAYREDLQPAVVKLLTGAYAFADNGNIVNYREERLIMEERGFDFESNNEAELILCAILDHYEKQRMENGGKEADFIESIKYVMQYFRGAFTSLLMTKDDVYGFVDPHGFRPLHFGETDDFWICASETVALDILHVPVEQRHELKPGQICHMSDSGVRFYQFSDIDPKRCIFELIYFSRPDSVQWGHVVYKYRIGLGKKLAQYDEQLVDMVMPVPDSANFIALGYALAKGISLPQFGSWNLIRNHYVGRTFIKPDQHIRDESVRKKYNPLPGVFEGKSIVLVDDSIVRGTTIKKIVSMIFQAGAREVHLRIGSPPKIAPCYYGIATPTYEEHAWDKYGGLDGIVSYIEEGIKVFLNAGAVFTLKYLPLGDLQKTVEDAGTFCQACFDGTYPVL